MYDYLPSCIVSELPSMLKTMAIQIPYKFVFLHMPFLVETYSSFTHK
jgi:hypothetical protein